MGGTGEIHTGVPYRIRKEKIRIAHDGGQKVLKPGALEKLRTIMLENEASAPMPGVQQQPAQERPIDAQSQCICGGSQRGRRFGGRGSRGRNTMKYRIGAHFGNF